MKKILVLSVVILSTVFANAQNILPSAPATDAVYRLPLEKGISVVAQKLSPLEYGTPQHTNQVDFCAWQLNASEPSKVYAAREGKVSRVGEGVVEITHAEGLVSTYERLADICVVEGQEVDRKTQIATTKDKSVVMTLYYFTSNPAYGTEGAVNGAYEALKHYVNPIFSSRAKCKVQLTAGNAYRVKVRNWCWPWE